MIRKHLPGIGHDGIRRDELTNLRVVVPGIEVVEIALVQLLAGPVVLGDHPVGVALRPGRTKGVVLAPAGRCAVAAPGGHGDAAQVVGVIVADVAAVWTLLIGGDQSAVEETDIADAYLFRVRLF